MGNSNVEQQSDFSVQDEDPSLPPSAQPQPQTPQLHHHNHHNNVKETVQLSAVCLIWCFVGLGAVYYAVTERKRRRRQLRLQRQARLQYYSPRAQAKRKLQLLEVLEATTCFVTKDIFIHCPYSDNLPCCQKQQDIEDDKADDISTYSQEDCGTTTSLYGIDDSVENNRAETIEGNNNYQKVQDIERGEIQRLCHDSAISAFESASFAAEQEAGKEDDDDDDDDEEEDDVWSLRLPGTTNLSSPSGEGTDTSAYQQHDMLVPALCVICLKQYHVNDRITWSPNAPHCRHAFHQQCLVEWLAKLPSYNCPCCRRSFCSLPSTSITTS